MDVSYILSGLNEAQREAVTTASSGMLVLAGAGSGKTRVLVHRVAWLLRVGGVAPWSVLAVTFTNKAAREMRNRIQEMQETPVGGMWVGTFHGLAHRLLRLHWQDVGLPRSFQILDSDDQFRLVKRIQKSMHLDEAQWPPRQAQGFINARKDEGLRAQHVDAGGDPYLHQMLRIYAQYQQACERSGLVDFAELLLRAHELWRDRNDILQHYRARFQHILVDEFQDINAIQYAWLRLLAGDRENLFIVGDDDQSIYGWRGARVEHIQGFNNDFPGIPLIRLEQNYRSSGNILRAANALIANNPSRLGKNLWTQDADGEPISLYAAFNEVDEARFVIDQIQHQLHQGHLRSEVAVLYRSNAQSRLFEEALVQAGVPYRVYGGTRFFERAEIKDALAYLRLLANPDDDASFERSVNMPPRGIGPSTLEAVRARAREMGCSLGRAATDLSGDTTTLTARARNALKGFLNLMTKLRATTLEMDLWDVFESAIEASRLREHYQKNKDGRGVDRIENLAELVNATRQFNYENDDEELDQLSAFLAHAALEAGEAQANDYEDCVQLMTLHSAKGLEFPLVFIVGVEEGLFPHRMSANDPDRLEEERRLCYVGMTRARQRLVITYAEARRLYGSDERPVPSRFIREIPPELIDEVRAGPRVTRPLFRAPGASMQEQTESGFRLGQRVSHPKFGEGVVLASEGRGASARIQVNFEKVGSKWLVLAYAKLEAAQAL